MVPNPFLGVFFHWLGGLASGSFYVPYKAVRNWAWEVYWLVGGFFSWIIAPWVLAFLLVPHLHEILHLTPWSVCGWAYFWGAMWGLGGLTFGLTMRYLGMSLGMAVALGFCAAFGTLMPPIFDGSLVRDIHTHTMIVDLFGVLICLCGIAVAGLAGISKEKEMPDDVKKAAIKEFNFTKGILVATFSGVMSASFSYGLAAADPMIKIATDLGVKDLWTGLPQLIIVLLGGFTSNFIWCVLLNIKNRTGYQYFDSKLRGPLPGSDEPIMESAFDAPGEEMIKRAPQRSGVAIAVPQAVHAPMLNNYFFSALAGVTWYMQFFFYTMGASQMGQYKFSSWTLHMSSIIIFSSLWGIALKEWKGASWRTKVLLGIALATLIESTIIIGFGNSLK